MKNKSFLIFLLAVASAATVAVSGCEKKNGNENNGSGHTHSYQWRYDSDKHWQECPCGEKKSEKPHVDELNNTTKKDGADGKCDVCGLEKVSISFEMQGHGAPVVGQKVYSGGKATRPTDPVADEWTFGGWCTAPGCTVPFDFDAPITADVTVYAKWTENSRPTVTFNANGHGTAPASVKAGADGKVAKPADLSEDDWIFGGWYKESGCTNEFNFATDTVTANTTLYAKWTADDRPKVTFDMQGYGTAPAPVRVEVGGTVSEPTTPANTLEKKFVGWYKESGCINEFNFENELITEDVIIYAKWVNNENPLVTFDNNGHGAAPASVRTDDNGKVAKPDDLTAADFIFGGWYKEATCTTPFDFDTDTITANTTLYAKWTADTRPKVTFNANGHGTAPASVRTDDNGKVAKPADLTATDFIFGGWYKEAACTNKFDFDTETISANTTLYAKWTPVYTDVTTDTQNTPAFGEESTLKFKFTSPNLTRYCINLRNEQTKACTFALDNDNATRIGDKIYFDLDKNETVKITVTRGAGLSDTDKINFVINEVIDEDLPAEGWVSGMYSNPSHSLELNKETKQVTYLEQTVTFTYIGGTINSIYFNYTVPGTSTINKAKLAYTGNGRYTFSVGPNSGKNYSSVGTLEYQEPQPPKTLAEISGVYTYNNEYSDNEVLKSFGGYTIISIYPSGNGYMSSSSSKTTSYTLGEASSRFDVSKNILYYGNYTITLVLDGDDNVIALKVFNSNLGYSDNNGTIPVPAKDKILVFNRTGDAEKEIPQKLPISATNLELYGANTQYAMVVSNGNVKWADNTAMTVTDVNEASGKTYYTVKKNYFTYTVEIEGSGDETVVKVYNSTHTELLDTLSKRTATAATLQTDGSRVTFAPVDTFGKWKSMFYTVPTTGKYSFTADSSYNKYMKLYTNINDFNVTGMNGITLNNATSVQLSAGSVIAISIAEVSSQSSYWFTATLTEAGGDTPDPGPDDPTPGEITGTGTQSDPYVFTDGGNKDIPLANGETAYIKLTSTDGGTYKLKIPTNDLDVKGTSAYKICTNIDGMKYGYDASSWSYVYNSEKVENGLSNYKTKPDIEITLAAGESVIIQVTQSGWGATLVHFDIEKV